MFYSISVPPGHNGARLPWRKLFLPALLLAVMACSDEEDQQWASETTPTIEQSDTDTDTDADTDTDTDTGGPEGPNPTAL